MYIAVLFLGVSGILNVYIFLTKRGTFFGGGGDLNPQAKPVLYRKKSSFFKTTGFKR